jgi:serine/threonine protein kinase
MDLVVGKPLTRVKWTVPLLRQVFAQVAEAIHAIHGQGKLHRDLKPSNVMISPAGRVVVLDFGLVSDQEPGGIGRALVEDKLAGTPAYMAPEQTTGRATPQSDWYASARCSEASSAGPLRGTGVAVLARKREEPAPRPEDAEGVRRI